MKMSKLPEFESDAEAAAWFDTHDTAPYMDDMEEANEKFEVIRTNAQASLNCCPFQSRK